MTSLKFLRCLKEKLEFPDSVICEIQSIRLSFLTQRTRRLTQRNAEGDFLCDLCENLCVLCVNQVALQFDCLVTAVPRCVVSYFFKMLPAIRCDGTAPGMCSMRFQERETSGGICRLSRCLVLYQ